MEARSERRLTVGESWVARRDRHLHSRRPGTTSVTCEGCDKKFASERAVELHICGYREDPMFEEDETGRFRLTLAGALVLGQRTIVPRRAGLERAGA